jgi:diguanylate cyclase
MAWMSFCLFMGGFSADFNEVIRQTWLISGAIGMIACIGLGNLLFVENRRSADLIRDYEIQALTDPLTNLPNRRAFDGNLTALIEDEQKKKKPCNDRSIFLAILDVDHFKRINDTKGHPTGDRVLRFVAQTIYSSIPDKCVAARLGGDEFGIVFVDVSPDWVAGSLKSIKALIEKDSLQRKDLVPTTISVGLTNLNSSDSYDSIYDRVDRALYLTKSEGRNSITFR